MSMIIRSWIAHVVWTTGGFYSLAVVVGFKYLEDRAFLLVVVSFAALHVAGVLASGARLSTKLFLVESCIALAGVLSVVLHTISIVGAAPPGWLTTFYSFIKGSLADPGTLALFAGYVAVFTVAVSAILLVGRFLRAPGSLDRESVLVVLYTASALNISLDYSLQRPLYNTGGDPSAASFFFAAGLFGLEFSLPLHMIMVVIAVWRYSRTERSNSPTATRYAPPTT